MSATPSRTSRPRAQALLAGLVIVPFLFVLAWGVVAFVFPRRVLHQTVQAQLVRSLAREVRYSGARLGIWPPVRLIVEGPELAEPRGFAQGRAFRARSIQLDLDLLALLGRRVVVRRIVVDRPELHLVTYADGRTNLDSLGRPAAQRPGSRPMDLEVRELVVRSGRALLDDLAAGRRNTLAIGSRVELSARRGGTRFATSGRTEISELAFGKIAATRIADLNRSLADLTWRIEHRGAFDSDKRRLALERLALAFGDTEVALTGIVDEPGPRARYDLRTRATRIELGELLKWLAAADARALKGIQGAGRVDLDLTARGRLGPRRIPSLTGWLTVREGEFRYSGAPAGVEGLAFGARFAPDSVVASDLRARVTGRGMRPQPIRGRFAVTRWADPRVSFALRGNLDLAAVAPLVAPEGTRLAGRAAVDVSGNGRARDPGSMALDGRARLADVSVERPDLPKRVEEIEGDIEFSPQRSQVRGLSARAGKSSFSLDATVSRPLAILAAPGKMDPAEVSFALTSPYLDLEELLPATPGAPLLPNVTGTGRVSVGRLRNRKLDVSTVAADVRMDPGKLAVPRFALTGYGGEITGNARFDLTNPQRPVYSVRSNVDSVQANDLLSTWTPLKGLVRGVLSSELELSGEGAEVEVIRRSITAAGLARFFEGTLGPAPALEKIAQQIRMPKLAQTRFKDLKTRFHVERGRVFTDDVVLRGDHGEWKLSGTAGFDGSLDYAVSATIPRDRLAGLDPRAALAAGALSDEHGNLLLDFRVRGTVKEPRVSYDLNSARDRLTGRVSDALQEQREKVETQLRDAADQRRRAAEDSARAVLERARRALADSLRRRAGDALKGFFGAGGDTTKP